MSAETTPPIGKSVIQTMHARYEQANLEWDRIDKECLATPPAQHSRINMLDRGQQESSRECDALRLAILHQVPDTWADALIMQYHASLVTEYGVGPHSSPAVVAEQEAMLLAVDAIFDFMACEQQEIDFEAIGAQFQKGVGMAFNRRRARTGVVED